MLIDDDCLAILTEFSEKSNGVGISQFLIQTHSNSAEITLEVCEAVA
jgi:hypothetical protein